MENLYSYSISSIREIVGIIFRSGKGIIGVIIITFYLILGFLGPSYIIDPEASNQQVADSLAVPEWITFFNPDIPINEEYIYRNWRILNIDKTGDIEVLDSNLDSNMLTIKGYGEVNITLETVEKVRYNKNPPRSILLTVNYSIDTYGLGESAYAITYYLFNSNLEGTYRNISQGELFYIIPRWYYIYYRDPPFGVISTEQYSSGDKDIDTSIRLPYHMINRFQDYIIPIYINPISELLFDKETEISIRINVTYICKDIDLCKDTETRISFGDVKLKIYGLAYGVMGTDNAGRDVFVQFILGARVANIFGISAAIVIVFFGILLGSVAGFRGGSKIDHLISFLTDTTFMLPGLPLLIAASLFFGRSTLVIYIVIILLSWPVIARLSRSWAMALRSEQYVEAAVALGASSNRIIRRYIIPAMIPLIVYGIVIEVPTVIFNEVLIQLLGFGDPTFPSWGRMLNQAYYEGALVNGAWWWILPPLTGVVSFTLGFVLIGLALDEYVNPKYRLENTLVGSASSRSKK